MSQINPLQPFEAKRTVCLETVSPHHDIEKFKIDAKREAYRQRNQEYVKSMYGDPSEKEEVRRNQRVALQQQVQDHHQQQKKVSTDRYRESEFAIQYDKACLSQDQEDRVNRKNYLKQFRDENKRLMDQRAEALKMERDQQYRQEQALLKQNPINWSKTLH